MHVWLQYLALIPAVALAVWAYELACDSAKTSDVHRYTKIKPSEYVPRSTCETPFALWSASTIRRLPYRLKTATGLSKKAV